MTPTKKRSRVRRVLDRAMLMSAGVFVALVLGEIVVRIGGFGPDVHPVFIGLFQLSDDPLLRYTLVPNAEYDRAYINTHGFRGSDVSRRKSSDTFRIVCIGDSICFGYAVGQRETFSARLEQGLNAGPASQGRRFEVLNFGVTGYNIVQIAENLRERVVDFDPDLIVYAYCLNDPQDFSHEFDALSIKLNKAEMRFREHMVSRARRLSLRSRLYALARFAVESSTPEGMTLRGLRKDPQFQNLHRGTHAEYFTRLHREPPGLTRLEDGLAAIGRIAREQEIPASLALFPLLVDPESYPFREVHEQVLALAEKENLHPIDLTDSFLSFKGDAFWSLTVDQLHPSAAGHTVAAIAILRGLMSHGLLDVADDTLARLSSAPEPVGSIARHLAAEVDDSSIVR